MGCFGCVPQATNYYKLFITWTNQKIKNTFVQRNMFEFQHIKVISIYLYCNLYPNVVEYQIILLSNQAANGYLALSVFSWMSLMTDKDA